MTQFSAAPATRDLDFSLLTADHPSQRVAAGEVIFSLGDTAGGMFVVKSGQVELRLGSRLLETVGPNGIFGEMALVDGGSRSATAVAISDSVPHRRNAVLRFEPLGNSSGPPSGDDRVPVPRLIVRSGPTP